MGHQRNTIPDTEYLERLKPLIPIFEVRADTKENRVELFFLYNDRLTPRKTNMSCGKCQRYVIDRMIQYFKELTNG